MLWKNTVVSKKMTVLSGEVVGQTSRFEKIPGESREPCENWKTGIPDKKGRL